MNLITPIRDLPQRSETRSPLLTQMIRLVVPASIASLMERPDLADRVEVRMPPSATDHGYAWLEGDARVRERMESQTLNVLEQVPVIHFLDLAPLVARAFNKHHAGPAVKRELKTVLQGMSEGARLSWDGEEDGFVWRSGHDRTLEAKAILTTGDARRLERVPAEELAGSIWVVASSYDGDDLPGLLRDVLALYGLTRKGRNVHQSLREALEMLHGQCPAFVQDGKTFLFEATPAACA